MKSRMSWTLMVSLALLAASALTYTLHYLIFHDAHHIFIYMLGDFGFLFLDVLLVILLIERLLAQREKRAVMKKMNMVIGAFFSEVGLRLLAMFSAFIQDAGELEARLDIGKDWSRKDFARAEEAARRFSYSIRVEPRELEGLRAFLQGKRAFLLRLLENPNLLEHEAFTDLLWAVFHLTEELEFRGEELSRLPDSDLQHIQVDMVRAVSQLVRQWVRYVGHLRESYPFLFSLAQRINPLNPAASALVTE